MAEAFWVDYHQLPRKLKVSYQSGLVISSLTLSRQSLNWVPRAPAGSSLFPLLPELSLPMATWCPQDSHLPSHALPARPGS